MRWLGLVGLAAAAWAVAPRSAAAQASYLQPGDVTVTCVDTSGTLPGTDLIQVTPLVALPSLTDPKYQIEYTDLEADANGVFYDFDENQSDIPLGGAKRAGEPTLYATSGLDAPDEQVFLFQGLLDDQSGSVSPPLIWGFQMSTAGGWPSMITGEVSALPSSLQSANTGLKSNGYLKFAYTGPTTGTRAELQAAIGDPNNWTPNAPCPTGLTVIDSTDGGTDDAPGDGAPAADAPVEVASADSGPGDTSGDGLPAADGGDSCCADGGGHDALGGAGGSGGGGGGVDGGSDAHGDSGMGGTAGGKDAAVDVRDATAGAEAGDARDAATDVTGPQRSQSGCGCEAGGGFGRSSSLGVVWLVAVWLAARARGRRPAGARARGKSPGTADVRDA
jgi:hypothetical protein